MRTPARTAWILTSLLVPLAILASAVGLFVADFYIEETMAPAMRGQDLVTFLLSFALAAMLPRLRRPSTRSRIVWIGLLGYMLYTYLGAAFAYRFNELFLAYIALFALSAFALGAVTATTDTSRVALSFDATTPRAPAIALLVLIALLVAASELGQIVSAYVSGGVPDLLVRSEGAGNFVFALDLGLILPLAVLGAVLLWRRSGWGFLLAGALFIKAFTMGLALLASTWFSVRAGQELELGLTIAYAVMTLGAGTASLCYFRHCKSWEYLMLVRLNDSPAESPPYVARARRH